jgi:hypothetical protein
MPPASTSSAHEEEMTMQDPHALRRRTATPVVRLAALVMGLVSAGPALADPLSPLDPARFAFPGSRTSPASAASAGCALADQWLADEPFANPAMRSSTLRGSATGIGFRVNRQDLAAGNRNFDQTEAFFDGASAMVGLPELGRLSSALYFFQPALRQEDWSYLSGLSTPNPTSPATIEGHADTRELRAGMAVSGRFGPGALGVGVEWSKREDSYLYKESSADVSTAGSDSLGFSGDQVGVQIGGRWDHGDTTAGSFRIGVGGRYLPDLDVDGVHTVVRASGTTRDSVHATRSAAWESGLSVRYFVTPGFHALGGAGVRGAQDWQGFGVTAGQAWEWKLGGEYHESRDVWTVRFGFGQEFQDDVAEPRANVFGVGAGWQWDGLAFDVGLVHRSISREGTRDWFDDRVLLTVRVPH